MLYARAVLFNSFDFLLVFLPVALLLDHAACRWFPALRLQLLLALSLVFYSFWDIRFAPLIVVSIGINWLVAEAFQRRRSDWLPLLAITINLAVLGWFKYAGFLTHASETMLTGGKPPDIVLPLGISFFTFHHIMYLVDLRAGRAPRMDLTRYGLYIAFFPQVLAGPLVRWSEILHQFEAAGDARAPKRADADQIKRGILLLVIGLLKKVIIADVLTGQIDPVFAAAQHGGVLTVADSWRAVLSFSFKIYFDFSGYTDMALGTALLFGITLPQNFNAPYRAASLQDFWRRWHMTLSRFLRDYLYIPLGGNRHGLALQVIALFLTMTLGGLWHGAGWTFVAWGVLHGLGLGVGLVWRRFGVKLPSLLGWAATFLFVTLAWVLFRAESFQAAIALYKAMFGAAPVGKFRMGNTGLIAAIVVFLTPTAWTLSQKLPEHRIVAVFAAIAFVLMLLKIGSSESYQFIYFQF